MIEHLRGREQALASLGWTGREAEWIALVCLHSGVFTRAQFCHYFDAGSKRGPPDCAGIGGTPGGGRGRMADIQWRRADVPDFRQGDLPGARSREHPPPAKGQPERRDAAASLA